MNPLVRALLLLSAPSVLTLHVGGGATLSAIGAPERTSETEELATPAQEVREATRAEPRAVTPPVTEPKTRGAHHGSVTETTTARAPELGVGEADGENEEVIDAEMVAVEDADADEVELNVSAALAVGGLLCEKALRVETGEVVAERDNAADKLRRALIVDASDARGNGVVPIVNVDNDVAVAERELTAEAVGSVVEPSVPVVSLDGTAGAVANAVSVADAVQANDAVAECVT